MRLQALFGLSVAQPPDWQHVQNSSFVMDGVVVVSLDSDTPPTVAPAH